MSISMRNTIASRPARNSSCVVRASSWTSDSGKASRTAALVSSIGAAAMLLAGAAGAKPLRLADRNAERTALREEQIAVMEYALRQQENARQAQLVAQRQALQNQLVAAEDSISKKIVEDEAAVVAAEAKGDTSRVDALVAQEAQLEVRAQQVAAAASQLKAGLDRVELVEKARFASAEQGLEKALQAGEAPAASVLADTGAAL